MSPNRPTLYIRLRSHAEIQSWPMPISPLFAIEYGLPETIAAGLAPNVVPPTIVRPSA
jgi:hypothetical protein